MEPLGTPEITVETVWRTILVTDARDSSKAYFSERADEALVRIERDRALFARIAVAHGGEEARDRGDGSMFAFDDPSAALRAAMLMQSEMARLNAALPSGALRLVHRMGIQMGSVKLAKTSGETPWRKLSGDIVVTAARLEAICHPGEVCFTNDVYRAVRGGIDHEFRFLDATLKGFDRPVRVWSTRLDRDWTRPLTAEEAQSKAQRREEKRLREKWEREQREKRRRRIAVVAAAWAAMLSLGCAAVSLLVTQTSFDPVARMREALREPAAAPLEAVRRPDIPEAVPSSARRLRAWAAVPKPPYVPASVHAPGFRLVSRRTSAALHVRPAKGRVTALFRDVLEEGRFEDLASRLKALGLPSSEFLSLYDDARRVELARDWLQERLEPISGDEPPGIRLEPPINGLSRITRAEDGRVYGFNDKEEPVSITFLDLSPESLGEIVRVVAGGDAPSDDPASIVQSLSNLRLRAGRR